MAQTAVMCFVSGCPVASVMVNEKMVGVTALTGPGGKPVGTTKGIDIEAQGTINGVPVYEFDLNSIENEEKPWRKPGEKHDFMCLFVVYLCFSRQEAG